MTHQENKNNENVIPGKCPNCGHATTVKKEQPLMECTQCHYQDTPESFHHCYLATQEYVASDKEMDNIAKKIVD